MLEGISLIASAISGLTAITTSLRALGRSREDDFPAGPVGKRLKALLLHIFVTFAWFGLAVVFAVLAFKDTPDISLIKVALPFGLVIISCCIIWWKTLYRRD